MILAVDTETTGTDRWHGCRPFLVTACDGFHNFYSQGTVNPHNRLEVIWLPETIEELQAKLESAQRLVFHNAKFDLHMLESIGINLEPLWDKIEDTLLASHVMCSGEPHGLKLLAFKYLNFPTDDEQALEVAVKAARNSNQWDKAKLGHPSFPGISGPKVQWWKMDYWMAPEECLTYGFGDVERTWLLWQMYYDAMAHHALLEQYERRKKLIRIAFKMESHGYNMYKEDVFEEIQYLTDRREGLSQLIQKELHIRGDLNLSKDKDIRYFLFTVLKLEPVKLTPNTGVASMDKDAISELIDIHPEIPALQYFKEYRTCGTQRGYLKSYLNWICEDGKIHGNIFITGTRNTRQSATDPNLQNIDKRLLHVFGPAPGYVWIEFDLVSIEPRIWAYLTGNKPLITLLEAGGSPHIWFSEIVYPEEFNTCKQLGRVFKEEYETTLYAYVKAGDLSIMYGASGKKADKTFHKVGAYTLIVEQMPELPLFNKKCENEVLFNLEKYHAPFVTCLGGYRLDVPLEDIYVGPNYKIQGTAGYIIGLGMIEIDSNPDYIQNHCAIVQQVHDSIKIEVLEELLTPELISSLQESIESAGRKYLPTCKASYKIHHNTQAPF